jgi:fucose permease
MNKSDHCKFCDHKIVDFSAGTLCKLTHKKPDFDMKCNSISLDTTFKQLIEELNIKYEAVKKTKVDSYGHFFFYLAIAIGVILTGYFIGKYALESGVISTVPLIIIAIGIGVLGLAIGPINHYRNELNLSKNNKERLDKIAGLYGYDYNIKIQHHQDSLGNKFYDTDLKIFKTPNKSI